MFKSKSIAVIRERGAIDHTCDPADAFVAIGGVVVLVDHAIDVFAIDGAGQAVQGVVVVSRRHAPCIVAGFEVADGIG